jgi:hypothetical protein
MQKFLCYVVHFSTPVFHTRAADDFYALIQLYNRYEWSYLGSATNAKAKVLVSSLAEQAPKDVLKKNDTAL